MAHGYFAYVNETSFAYPEHLVHEGVAKGTTEALKFEVMPESCVLLCVKDSFPYNYRTLPIKGAGRSNMVTSDTYATIAAMVTMVVLMVKNPSNLALNYADFGQLG